MPSVLTVSTSDAFLPRAVAATARSANPLRAKEPHHEPTAKSVIWLFMEGGPSHIDLFDPKPALDKLAGQPMPTSFGKVITAMGTAGTTILPSKRTWKQHGQSGTQVSDWYPEIAKHVDDLCVFRGCLADGLNHVGSVCQMNTGSILAGRPSLGAWVTYGLGTANENLPTFVILTDDREVVGGPKNWSAGFLPAAYQGTLLRNEGAPILDLVPPDTINDVQQRSKLDLLAALNKRFGADKQEDSELEARISSYELAYNMQKAAPEAVRPFERIRCNEEALRHGSGGDSEVRCQLPARPPPGGTRSTVHRIVFRQRQRLGCTFRY